MRYKRQESFRYQFNEQIQAEFTFKSKDNPPDSISHKGVAYLHDISPNGLSFQSEFDLPIIDNHSTLTLVFALNDETFSLPGHLIWKKKLGNRYHYGFKGIDSSESKQKIVEVIKKHARQNKH